MSDKKERKCIGVIISRPNREYQTDILRGIYRAAFEHDMNVAVFCTVSKTKELDMYSLPNYERLAGMIYARYTFDYDNADKIIRPLLTKAVREKNFPAVSLDYKIDGIPCVMCDDSRTVGDVLEHIITVHKCRDIAYMTGTKGHMHAESRLEVFRRTMEAHGLPILPGRIYYGDFWFNEGEKFVDSLINSENGLPEAIVCANDYMACSVYQALYQKGISIPRDIILAEYCDESDLYPFITGAIKQVENAGYKAGRMLIEMIDGKKIGEQTVSVKCSCRMNESVTCGCTTVGEYDFVKSCGKNVNDKDGYFSEYNYISTDLLNRSSFRELFWGIDFYSLYVKNIAGLYFCLLDGWDKPDFNTEKEREIGYTERMQLYYYRRNNEDGSHESVFENYEFFPSSEMLPKIFDAQGKPSSYIFRPFCLGDKNFGYIVIDNGSALQTYDHVFDCWVKDISNAMEAQCRLQNMKYLFTSDLMTGIYNRNGFNNKMPDMIKYASEKKVQFFIAVFDLNGMKFINDTYGHLEGDVSIKTAADIISECVVSGAQDEKNFRIGGDEFVKAAVGFFTEKDISDFRHSIEQHISDYNRTSGKAYPIYISVGICIKSPGDEYTLDSVIYEADKEMFIDKARVRKSTGFDPKREA